MEAHQSVTWQAHEYNHTEKGKDWYWALWIIITALAGTAILFDNALLAILLVVGGVSLSLYAARKPLLMNYSINDRGIMVGNDMLFPFSHLDSFNIFRGKILIKQRKTTSMLLVIPLMPGMTEEDEADIRAILKQHLLEEEIQESLSQIVMEWLGF